MSSPLERLLAWEQELLRAASLEQWLEHLARLPEDATREVEVALRLADPTHELRQLATGGDVTGDSAPPWSFVASLAGLAPHLLSLQGAWRGEHVVGSLNAATRDERPVLDGVEASRLAHASWRRCVADRSIRGRAHGACGCRSASRTARHAWAMIEKRRQFNCLPMPWPPCTGPSQRVATATSACGRDACGAA